MGEFTALIMSMDAIQLGLIGAGAVGSLGLVAYQSLKKDKLVISSTNETLDSSKKENNLEDNYTVNTQIEVSQVRPRLTDNLSPNITASELIESALVYDSYGSRDEALQSLADAIQKETHPKEKVRLHVIYKNYSVGAEKLSEIVSRYPKISKEDNSTKVDIFESKTTENFPILTDIVSPGVTEYLLAEIAQETQKLDEAQKAENEEGTNNFFAEFGALAQQIKKENELDSKKKQQHQSSVQQQSDCFDIWANYMSLNGGRMNLKNTFVHLENPWGTVAAIAELQERINKEIGFEDGYQIPWAIISVLPILDPK